ncbi:hypothetical protein V1J52_06260 [Streptomyces sp. TRM 70351]|uniref:hypothetical protein n=1 Tax=Streptomyces sp. TRM 70351 TaxID=3116552 RepID=UPI002E7BCD70|nr:hypothetical protein [Streptomyces sp. TRM 70351]MEE1927797.1 hypothetical protein [Streptomyces sp. TRM 70351]
MVQEPGTTSRRPENQSLRELLTAADWTYEALARAVNALGSENGVPLTYDRTSVARWLTGSVPRPHTRGPLTEASARRLHRPVTLADLGMGDTDTAAGGRGGRGRTGRRGPAVGGALLRPRRRLRRPPRPDRADRLPQRRRHPPAVRAAAGPAHRRLLAEAARLAHVLARMYVDDVRNGAAQQYHRAALHLAVEAGDRTSYAAVLRGTSSHALGLGPHETAVRLSGTALRTAPADAPPGVRALLLSQLALARAASGDHHGAAAALTGAEEEGRRAGHECALPALGLPALLSRLP